MITVKSYLDLIPAEHRDKPKFQDTISVSVEPSVQIQIILGSLVTEFDVDYAVGAQLDVIGEWVGVSRNLNAPIEGIYFEWDGAATVGWDYGTWKDEFDPSTGIVTLPDDAYRSLLKGRIAANSWDGTTEDAYRVWAIAFPGVPIVIQDNQDMTIIIGVAGTPLSALTKAILLGGYIPLKPEGVKVTYSFVTVEAPIFGWDIENDIVSGWDEGAWGSNL